MSDLISTKTQSEAETLLGRSFFYRLLAELFRHPSAQKRGRFMGDAAKEWKSRLASLDCQTKEPLAVKLHALFCMLKKIDFQERVCQYEQVFGHTAHSRIPAYELEYGEEHSHRQPQELGDIAAFYQAFGLRMAAAAHERDDHVSVECEFMHVLLWKQLYALAEGMEDKVSICKEAAGHFLSEHLGRWMPAFAARLARESKANLMGMIGDFALAFIAEDCRLSGVKAGESHLPIRKIQEKEETGCISCQYGPGLPVQGKGSDDDQDPV